MRPCKHNKMQSKRDLASNELKLDFRGSINQLPAHIGVK